MRTQVAADEDGAPITELTTLSYDLETLCRLAQVVRCTPHQLRHTFAPLVADEGYNESVVAALIGHERRGDEACCSLAPADSRRWLAPCIPRAMAADAQDCSTFLPKKH